jgi:hypothetical protein
MPANDRMMIEGERSPGLWPLARNSGRKESDMEPSASKAVPYTSVTPEHGQAQTKVRPVPGIEVNQMKKEGERYSGLWNSPELLVREMLSDPR